MKKTFFYSLFVLTALLVFGQTTSAEARDHHRRHHRSSTRVQVNVGESYGYRDAYVVRRYARPVVPVVYAPAPYYAAPVYVAEAPLYVEEMHVVPARRPLSFTGLSLSWNFFR